MKSIDTFSGPKDLAKFKKPKNEISKFEKNNTRINDRRDSNQGAASLTVTAKSSFERYQNFNDIQRHRHKS